MLLLSPYLYYSFPNHRWEANGRFWGLRGCWTNYRGWGRAGGQGVRLLLSPYLPYLCYSFPRHKWREKGRYWELKGWEGLEVKLSGYRFLLTCILVSLVTSGRWVAGV